MKNTFLLAAIPCLFLAGCQNKPEKAMPSPYPETAKTDTVDNYFGTAVPDPYRWLENDTTQQTAAWVKAQNEVTFGYLNNIPYRDAIKKRLEKIFNYERLSAPFQEGEFYYFYKNDGLQNQSVLYRKKGEDGTAEVFIDPNKFRA
ncbi:MAG: S9 family peptidase, partial [Chryseotalea sp.]